MISLRALLGLGAAMPLSLGALSAQSGTSCTAATHDPAPAFDAKTLRQGRFVYREISNGRDTSTFTLEIRHVPDSLWIFTGEGSGQRWVSVADSSFHPWSAELSMARQGRPYDLQLRYAADSVRSIASTHNAENDAVQIRRSWAIPTSIVDQRIDWASLMSSDLAPGHSATYPVFDLTTGVSELSARAIAGPRILGPEGARETVRLDYTICKVGKAESYTVYATTELPRVMLREDLRGSVVSELVSMEP